MEKYVRERSEGVMGCLQTCPYPPKETAMLSVMCRRQFFRIGGLGSIGLTLARLFETRAGPTTVNKLEKIPAKVVVLTFDDACKSHHTVVWPLLKQYGFGATFYVTEGFNRDGKNPNYMTWDDIVQIHKDGFEIGNHTRFHQLDLRGIEYISDKCKELGI